MFTYKSVTNHHDYLPEIWYWLVNGTDVMKLLGGGLFLIRYHNILPMKPPWSCVLWRWILSLLNCPKPPSDLCSMRQERLFWWGEMHSSLQVTIISSIDHPLCRCYWGVFVFLILLVSFHPYWSITDGFGDSRPVPRKYGVFHGFWFL